MNLGETEHRRYIASIYKSHQGGSAKDFENFYQAQCLWDEAMAETLSRFLQSPDGRRKTVLVIVGSGHVAFDFGIPKRLYRRTPLLYKTIILKEWKKNVEEDFALHQASSPLAHFLWITKPAPPEKKRPRIGVLLKETEEPKGIWIERVIPGSPAEKAGLLAGDQFLAIDGKEVTKVKEIQETLAEKGWGKDVTVTIIREGSKKDITVILPPPRD
jgi:membrane-associated protease RseP (regulator of RpoE activity)